MQLNVHVMSFSSMYLVLQSQKSFLERFLSDIPVYGFYAKEKKRLCHILAERTDELLSEWENDELRHKQKNISPLLAKHFCWPSSIFLPKDMCSALFIDQSQELKMVIFLQDIESLGYEIHDMLKNDDFHNISYKEFIEACSSD